VVRPKKLVPVVDLMSALKQSLAEMEGKKKPAAHAGGKPRLHKRNGAEGAEPHPFVFAIKASA